MEFRIADTFTGSLGRLTGEEQKAVKTTAFDLQLDPSSAGMQFHKLDRVKDKNFWSVRAGSDIRLIVHKTADSLLLCYVDHHDAAYRWAQQRKIERHPTTGAAQLVEVRETIREIETPRYVETAAPSASAVRHAALFDTCRDDELLGYGVPAEWLADVRAATEDSLFELAGHLPGEAAEALLELATGGTPQRAVQVAATTDPFAHPDAQRRFRVMATTEGLQRALDFPWEKWTVFLHPAQQQTVDRRYSGPARVSGSAGTGKTIVALHRAVHLARAHPQAKVLLTTFSDTLARALGSKLERLVAGDGSLQERIVINAIDRVGLHIYETVLGAPRLADEATISSFLRDASAAGVEHRFTQRFLETEWRDVVDQWQLATWESYRDVARLGRKTRLGEQQRAVLWAIFERVRARLAEDHLLTLPGVFAAATAHLSQGANKPFEFVVIDEAQDIGVPQLRLLAALAGDRPDGLFLAGDLGQRIFQTPFSWRSLGVDVRGRSQTLKINYRTSHQIRRQADRLLSPELADVDGNVEVRSGTVSAFNGPEPVFRVLDSPDAETRTIADWLRARAAEGFAPEEIGVFVRSDAELNRARTAVASAGLIADDLNDASQSATGAVGVGNAFGIGMAISLYVFAIKGWLR